MYIHGIGKMWPWHHFALIGYGVGAYLFITQGDGLSPSERSAILSFTPPPDQYEDMRGNGSHMLRRVEAGESWDVSHCLAYCSSCPATSLVPGAGSRFVPTNEAVRSHTKCGSDVCPHVDLHGESRCEYCLDIDIFTPMQPTVNNHLIRTNAATSTLPHLWEIAQHAYTYYLEPLGMSREHEGAIRVHEHVKRLTRCVQEGPHWNPTSSR